jgi:type I restriction enzyme S subunit
LSQIRYTPFAENDILWAKITPCMQNGKSCIVRGLQNGIGFGSTEFHVFRSIDNEVLQEFIWEFLNMDALRSAAIYAFSGSAGHQRVPDSFLADLPFPKLTVSGQTRLINHMANARAVRKSKQSEADDLLAGLDGFVLDALGLTLPPLDGRIVYVAMLGEARQRFDADYHSPRFRTLRQKIEKGKFTVCPIGELFDPIVSGFAAGGDAQTDDIDTGVPHIRPLNITSDAELTFEGTKMVPRDCLSPSDYLTKGEVLFNNTNSTAWVGKTVVFDADRDCACSNHITRMKLKDKNYSPYYFAALFNAFRGLGYFGLLATNFNNQAGINVETLKNVCIPVPKDGVQTEIAEEVARRRKKARQLRSDADLLWNEAKHRFEEELLGPEPSPEELKPTARREVK